MKSAEPTTPDSIASMYIPKSKTVEIPAFVEQESSCGNNVLLPLLKVSSQNKEQ